MMMGLRLDEGVDLSRLQQLPGYDASWIDENDLTRLADAGLVTLKEDVLQLTPSGRPLINAVLGTCSADLAR